VAALIVVGDQATPMLAGAKSEPGWQGELVHVPDASSAVEALASRLGPGDTVLVKASRQEGLWQVAEALLPEHPQAPPPGAAR
jgi:UDP-N-acetylmuramyl pentapeptide synthase